MELLRITTEDGKYTLIQQDGGAGEILRNGEPWLAPLCNVPASKMILSMGYELERLRLIEAAALRWFAGDLRGDEFGIIRANSHRIPVREPAPAPFTVADARLLGLKDGREACERGEPLSSGISWEDNQDFNEAYDRGVNEAQKAYVLERHPSARAVEYAAGQWGIKVGSLFVSADNLHRAEYEAWESAALEVAPPRATA